MKIKQFAINVALTLAVVASVLTTIACPKSKDQLRSAIEASYRLPAATNDVIAKVVEAKEKGYITADQSRELGTVLNDIARGEVVFVGMVRAANETFQQTGTIDKATQANLRSFFDSKILEPFLRVLEAAKLLTGTDVSLILVAVSAVRLLISTIARGIGSKKAGLVSVIMPADLKGGYA